MSSTMTTVSEMDSFMAMLRGATPEQWLEFMKLQHERGMPLFNADVEEAEAAAPKPAAPKGKAKKAGKVSEAAAAVIAASAGSGSGSVSGSVSGHQRLAPSAILPGVCMGRALKADKQYKPHVYRERQCGSACVEGSDLCSKCDNGQKEYAADPSYHKWPGRITEEPFDWVHMMGTAWAEEKKPKFIGSGGASSSSSSSSSVSAASDSGSENGDAEEMSAPAPAPAPAPAAKPKKVSAAAAAKKEAAAAAKAERDAAKAEKAAADAAAKAEKAAAAAAAKPAKTAKSAKTAKPVKAAAAAAAAAVAVPAAAASDAVPEDSEGELTFIKGENYMVKTGGRVYKYDEDTEKTGDYVGRLTAFRTIDDTIPEEADAESDSESESKTE